MVKAAAHIITIPLPLAFTGINPASFCKRKSSAVVAVRIMLPVMVTIPVTIMAVVRGTVILYTVRFVVRVVAMAAVVIVVIDSLVSIVFVTDEVLNVPTRA